MFYFHIQRHPFYWFVQCLVLPKELSIYGEFLKLSGTNVSKLVSWVERSGSTVGIGDSVDSRYGMGMRIGTAVGSIGVTVLDDDS